MANEIRREVYDSLKDTYDLGSFDDFDKAMNDSHARSELWNVAHEEFDLGSVGQWDEIMRDSKYKLNIGGEEKNVSEKEYKDFMSRNQGGTMAEPKPAEKPRARFDMQAEENQVGENGLAVRNKGNESVYTPFTNQRSSTPEERVAVASAIEGDVTPFYRSEEDKTQLQYGNSPEDWQRRESRRKDEEAIMAKQRNEVVGKINETLTDTDKRIADMEKERKAWRASHTTSSMPGQGAYGQIGAAMGGSVVPFAREEELQNARVEKRQLENAQQYIQSMSGENDSFLGDVAKSFGETVTDMDTWDFGLGDMNEAMRVRAVLDKADSGEQLSESEKKLLDAVVLNTAATMYYQHKDSAGRIVGSTSAMMIPFMIEMAANPAAGIGRAAQSATFKKLARWAANSTMKRYALRGAQGAARVFGDIGAGFIMAGTTGIAQTIGDAERRMTGMVDVDPVTLTYKGRKDVEQNGLIAGAKAVASGGIERQSELVGEYFAPLVGFVGKRVANGIAKGVEKFGNETIKNYVNKFADIYSRLEKSKFAKSLTVLNDYTRYNGAVGEYLEEVVGNSENAAFVGDMNFGTGENGVFNPEDNMTTFLAVAVPGVVQGVLKLGFDAGANVYTAKKVRSARESGQKVFGDVWQYIQSDIDGLQIDGSSPQSLAREYRKLLNNYTAQDADNPMAEQEQKAIRDYFEAKVIQGTLGFAVKLRNEDELDRQDDIRQVADDEIAAQTEASDAEIDARVNQQSGVIVPAVMKNDNRQVYVVSGDVVMMQDGSGVDREKSSQNIIVRDAQTGELEFATPADILGIDEAMNPNELKTQAALDIQGRVTAAANAQIAGLPTFALNDALVLNTPQGQMQAVVTDEINADGLITVQVGNPYDGTARSLQFTPEELSGMVMSVNGKEVEKPSEDVTPKDGLDNDIAENTTAATETQPAEDGAMPMIGEGEDAEPDFMAVPVERTRRWIDEESQLSPQAKKDFVEAKVKEAQSELDKAKKGEPKFGDKNVGTSISKYNRLHNEWQAQMDEAQRKVDYWKQVARKGAPQAPQIPQPTQTAMQPVQSQPTQPAQPRATTKAKTNNNSGNKSLTSEIEGLGEPLSMDEWLMRAILNGSVKFIWNSGGVGSRGLGEHLGLADSQRERGRRLWMLANADKGGMLPEKAAERLLVEYAAYMGWEGTEGDWQVTSQDIFNKILDITKDYDTKKMLAEGIKEIHKSAGEISSEEEEYQKEEFAKSNGFDTFAEWDAYESSVEDNHSGVSEEEINDYYEQLYEYYANQRTEDGAGQGSEILPGQTLGNNEGGNQGSTGQGGNAQVPDSLSGDISQTTGVGQSGEGVSVEDNGDSTVILPRTQQIQGLEGYTKKDVENMVRGHIEEVLGEDNGVEIVGIKVIGSRVNGNADEDSDLDVLVEYKGEWSEDALFNVLNDEENRLVIEGIPVDINPITEDKSGTIEQFLKRNEGYKKNGVTSSEEKIIEEEGKVNTNPTEGQKKAGNYKMGHIKVDGFDVTIENPKGSVRRGTDASGKAWEQTMQNSYGYIRGTEGVDGDHIDVFLSDYPDEGYIYVIDQIKPDGSFDEHKVMYGFDSVQDAVEAYLSNYEEGWQGLGAISRIERGDFKKWLDSSHRKTKPFSEYSGYNKGTYKGYGNGITAPETQPAEKAQIKRYHYNIGDEFNILLDNNEPRRAKVLEIKKTEGKKWVSLDVEGYGTITFSERDANYYRRRFDKKYGIEETPEQKEARRHREYVGSVVARLGEEYTGLVDVLSDEEVEGLYNLIKKRDKLYSKGLRLGFFDKKGIQEEVNEVNKEIEDTLKKLSGTTAPEVQPAEKSKDAVNGANREAGGAIAEHLTDMGIDVSSNVEEYRETYKTAKADKSENGVMREMRNSDGKVYGFTYRGKIYLDPRKMSAELPLHEYGHLWCEALRRLNPENWKKVVDAIKADKESWEFVKQYYPTLSSDSEIAEEVIAEFSGKKGAEKLEEELKRMSAKDASYKSKWGNIFKNISKAIQDFWKTVGDFLGIEYKSAEQVYDQVLKDFADKVNPRKKLDEYLRKRNEEYLQAAEDGNIARATEIFNEALMEEIGNGMTPFVSVDSYRNVSRLAHLVKEGNKEAIERAARMMAPYIPENAVLIPTPSHTGKATGMLELANAIAEITGRPVADVLKGKNRQSSYSTKKAGGKAVSSAEMGIELTGELPEGMIPIVIDNVVDSGNTAEACIKALGRGIVVTLGNAVDNYNHVVSLRSAAPVAWNRQGYIIPLSQRFNNDSKYIGRSEKAPSDDVVAESLIQGELFSDNDFKATEEKTLAEMSDGELLDAMRETPVRPRDAYEPEAINRRGMYAHEYDKRHQEEYGKEADAYAAMLEQENTSLDDAYAMYSDVSKQWINGGHATEERTKLRAQIDALEVWINEKETEKWEAESEEEDRRIEEAERAEKEEKERRKAEDYEKYKGEVHSIGVDLTQIRLRKLEEGETSLVERRYTETGAFSFTSGKERIESTDDVAYIFKQLETAAVENSFIVLVKDGVPTVIHVGMGNYTSAMVGFDQSLAAWAELKPDAVYMIHNHPSGTLRASNVDMRLATKLERVFGPTLRCVIIDTTSGKYVVFDSHSANIDEREIPTVEGREYPVRVFQFSKAVFDENFDAEKAYVIKSTEDAAAFVSSHRLGKHKKMSLLVLNNQQQVLGNVFLPWMTLENACTEQNANLIASIANQMGGTVVVLYGNFETDERSQKLSQKLNKMISDRDLHVMDILHTDVSAASRGWIAQEPVRQSFANEEPAVNVRDALIDTMRDAGIDVVTDWEEGQSVLDMANGTREQRMLSNLAKAEHFIINGIKNKKSGKSFEIELPAKVLNMVRRVMGRDFDSHVITIDGIRHGLKNHGIGGKKLTENSIPIREEDAALIPYIMTAPDYVKKGSTMNNRDSIRFYKTLENGYVVVVEKEFDNSDKDLETINIWGELSDVNNAQRTLYRTSETPTIGRSDAAKIRKDAETAIKNEEKIKQQRVYHGTGADFDAFDHSHMGEGEGNQSFGWGTYVTEVAGIGKTYAERIGGIPTKTFDGYPVSDLDRPLTDGEAAARHFSDYETVEDAISKSEDWAALFEQHAKDYPVDAKGAKKLAKEYRQAARYYKEHGFEGIGEIGNRILYSVDIPEDNGSNYLTYSETIEKPLRRKIAYAVRSLEGEPAESIKFAKYANGWESLANMIERNQWSYQEIRDRLVQAFGGKLADEKRLSELIGSIGFVGVKYPANFFGGDRSGESNYVIFNESNLKIEGKERFFRTAKGEVYGFTMGGKIYIDPRIANTETPIHEYIHLWAEAIRGANPMAWEQLTKAVLGEKDVLEYVQNLYPTLSGTDLIEEVFAHYAGRRGAERLQAEQQARLEEVGSNPMMRARVIELFDKIRKALSGFWQQARDLFAGKVEGIEKMSAEDFADMAMVDLLSGFNPGGNSDKLKMQKADKTLMGVHNISEVKLRKAIKQGGLANPSLAVIDTKKGMHSDYGEISLIPTSSLIDAETGRNAGTFAGDAWTPTYPSVDKIMSDEGYELFFADLREMADMRGELRMGWENYLEGRNPNNLAYWFLNERGEKPENIYFESGYTKQQKDRFAKLTDDGKKGFTELTEEERNSILSIYAEKEGISIEDLRAKYQLLHDKNEEIINNNETKDFRKSIARKVNKEIEEYGISLTVISDFMYGLKKALENDGRLNTNGTLQAAYEKMQSEGLESEFTRWLEDKEQKYGVKEMIFVGYTDDGDRKYIPNTVANASKIMNEESDANAGDQTGFGATRATLLKKMYSLDDIRKQKGKLEGVSEETEKRYQEASDEMFDIVKALSDMQTITDNPFSNVDYANARLIEALGTKDPIVYLNREFGYRISKSGEFAKGLKAMLQTLENLPVKYFETKFKRPVTLDEFAIAVVPEGTSREVLDALEKSGLDVRVYDNTGEDAEEKRREAVMDAVSEREDILFREGEEETPVFISNAMRAVEQVKQEKATGDQWVAMLQKAGGLKAGEDKWLGLSDWLKGKKSVTKQEVLDYIQTNQIEVEDVWYSEGEPAELNNKIDQFKQEFEECMAEAEEETGSIYIADHAERAFDIMVDRYGDDFREAFEIQHLNNGVWTIEPQWDWNDELSSAAKYYLGYDGLATRPINSTRLDYTTEGLENKREVALVVPNIESWNEDDDIHFGDAGNGRAVAWVRFGDTDIYHTTPVVKHIDKLQEPWDNGRGMLLYYPEGTKEGWDKDYIAYGKIRTGEMKYVPTVNEKYISAHDTLEEALDAMNEYYKTHPDIKEQHEKVLVIDEIQSKRHQEGREKGYYDKDYATEYAKLTKEERRAKKAVEDYFDRLILKYNILADGTKARSVVKIEAQEAATFEERDTMLKLMDELSNARSKKEEFEEERGSMRNLVPDAPFDKNWHELAMKRMLRYAAENGYDKVAWTTGEQQAERYNIGKVIKEISVSKWGENVNGGPMDADNPNDLRDVLLRHDIDSILLSVNREGVVAEAPFDKEFEGKQLSEIIGKDLAQKVVNTKGRGNISGDDLRIGGEGMKGFYDDILPRFMNKYGKKWGVKVDEVYLPLIGETMHSVDVTPEMKESVMEGQTLFRMREDEAPKKTGVGYKVFVVRDGQLYPPMVANPNGEATPVGVWLDADAAPVAGTTKTGRKQVKAGGKGTQGGSGKLAYRPGWHLGEIPYALQFNRVDPVTGEKSLFPANFVWAEVEYADDVDYQDEAMSYGRNANGKFQHSLAGLPRVPENGSYKYRTNPDPKTDAWVITGAMKVNRILKPSEVDEIVRAAGREPQRRQEGAITDEQVERLNERIEEMSREGEPMTMVTTRKTKRYTHAQQQAFAERQLQRKRKAAEDTAKKLNILDDVIIVDNIEEAIKTVPEARLTEKQMKARGWFRTRQGKIVVVLENHRDASDVVVTMLHEGVAHYGLRKLFGKNFDTFLDNVFNAADEDVRRRIVELAKAKDWNFRTATEEYLASLAEDMDFEHAEHSGWWQKIKRFFMDMLRQIGVRIYDDYKGAGWISDNELRYILWRSYENLAEPGMYRNPFSVAEDVVMQDKLKVGEFAEIPVDEPQVTVAAEPLYSRDGGEDINDTPAETEAARVAHDIYEDAVSITGNSMMITAFINSILKGKKGWEQFKHQFAESWFDYSRSIKALQDAIEKATGKAIAGFEDVWKTLNAKPGVDMVEINEVQDKYISPMAEYIGSIIKNKKIDGKEVTLDDVEKYLNAVHGQERNVAMAMKQAQDEYDRDTELTRKQLENPNIAPGERNSLSDSLVIKEARFKGIKNFMDNPVVVKWWKDWNQSVERAHNNGTMPDVDYKKVLSQMQEEYNQGWQYKYREKDYSGLTALFRDDFPEDEEVTEEMLEQAARDYAAKFEEIIGKEECKEMWQYIDRLNSYSLRKSYLSGLINKQQYDDTLSMYEHYVPLRGWHDDYAGDIYQYISRGEPTEVLQRVLKKAYGRKSRAARIFGTMAAMANSAIVQGNKNLVAQKFLNMAINHTDAGLLMVTEQWYQKDANGNLVPQFPNLREDMTVEEMQDEIVRFQTEMQEREERGEVEQLRKKFKKEMPLNMSKWQEQHHAIRVLRNGREYMVYILGNPRAAESFNGLLNPYSQPGVLSNILSRYMRFRAKWQTSLSPEFLISNFQRDVMTATTGAYIKFGKETAEQFTKNLTKVMPLTSLLDIKKGKTDNPTGIFSLFKKYENGTLNKGNEMERYFDEFVRNGGMTGISYITRSEEYQASMEDVVKRIRQGKLSKPRQMAESVGEIVEFTNKGIENATRFAMYMTSRQQGKNVVDSIFDAKEASVNFNMKGSGAWGNMMARRLYLYVNPSMQALRMVGTWYENEPVITKKEGAKIATKYVGKRFMKTVSFILATSVATAIVNILLSSLLGHGDGDDDDKGKTDWWALSEWNRYNYINFINPFGKGYFHWSIPQELRPIWAIGQIAVDTMFGKITAQHGLNSMLSQLNNLTPLSFFEGGTTSDDSTISSLIRTFTPSFVSDFTDAYGWNRNFLGSWITNQNSWNEDYPEWQRAGEDTPKWMVYLSKEWNDFAPNGRTNNRSKFESRYVNPSAIYYIMTQQFGGVGSMVKRLNQLVEQVADSDKEVELRNVPFVPKFYVSTGDDYSTNRITNEKFRMYWNEFKAASHELSRDRSMVKDGSMSEEEANKTIEERKADGSYNTYQVIYNNYLDKLYNALKGTKEANDIKKMIIDAVENGNIPDFYKYKDKGDIYDKAYNWQLKHETEQ